MLEPAGVIEKLFEIAALAVSFTKLAVDAINWMVSENEIVTVEPVPMTVNLIDALLLATELPSALPYPSATLFTLTPPDAALPAPMLASARAPVKLPEPTGVKDATGVGPGPEYACDMLKALPTIPLFWKPEMPKLPNCAESAIEVVAVVALTPVNVRPEIWFDAKA